MPRCARLAEGLPPDLECVLRRPVPGGVSWCCDDRRRTWIGTLVVVGDERFRRGRGDRNTVGVADDVRHLPVQHRPGAFGRRSSDHAPRLEVLGAAFDRPRVVDPGQLRVLFAAWSAARIRVEQQAGTGVAGGFYRPLTGPLPGTLALLVPSGLSCDGRPSRGPREA